MLLIHSALKNREMKELGRGLHVRHHLPNLHRQHRSRGRPLRRRYHYVANTQIINTETRRICSDIRYMYNTAGMRQRAQVKEWEVK